MQYHSGFLGRVGHSGGALRLGSPERGHNFGSPKPLEDQMRIPKSLWTLFFSPGDLSHKTGRMPLADIHYTTPTLSTTESVLITRAELGTRKPFIVKPLFRNKTVPFMFRLKGYATFKSSEL